MKKIRQEAIPGIQSGGDVTHVKKREYTVISSHDLEVALGYLLSNSVIFPGLVVVTQKRIDMPLLTKVTVVLWIDFCRFDIGSPGCLQFVFCPINISQGDMANGFIGPVFHHLTRMVCG